MTKLLEWLAGGTVFLFVWGFLILNTKNFKILEEQKTLINFLPVIVILHFGLYAATVVLWRVFTFNNCEKAAAELQNEIKLAKEDLAKKGFKFSKSTN